MHELFEIVLRAIAEIFFEALLKFPGWLILSAFRNDKSVDADGCLVISIGIAFWSCVVGVLCWWLL